MKIKKYGGFEMVSGSELNFAIVVKFLVGEVEEEKLVYRFITGVDRQSRRWEIENKKSAYLFSDRSVAQAVCACMLQNGMDAFVVECLGKDKLKNWF